MTELFLAAAGALTTHQVTVLFLSLAVLLGAARLMGEVTRRFNQPAVLGEILAGVILGPTVLGRVMPAWQEAVFPKDPAILITLDGLTTLAVALFLLVAGMEVDLSRIWRQGKIAAAVSIAGILVPFALGFGLVWIHPPTFGMRPGSDALIFALFFATALSISALPVIAKTLIDLNLYRTDLGMVVIAASIVNDLVGWILFAMIQGLNGQEGLQGAGLDQTVMLTLGYTVVMLTVGRWVFHWILPWLQAYLSWPGGVIGVTLVLALLGASFTQWIGIHGIFGAFIAGVIIGDSSHLREQTRNTLNQFISFFFAPIFFASIGLHVDFVAHFDPLLVAVVLVVACVGKVLGCSYAARWCGMEKHEAWALGFAMNARGAMEIILGVLAKRAGLIDNRLFVALVVMALVTSLISGPAIQRILRRTKPRRFVDYLVPQAFVAKLGAGERSSAIRELARALAGPVGLDATSVAREVQRREVMMATGLPGGVAVPHARLKGLNQPAIAVGLSQEGIDFEASDDKPAKLIFLILTPKDDHGSQLQILADIGRTFQDERTAREFLTVQSYTQFLAMYRSEVAENGGDGPGG